MMMRNFNLKQLKYDYLSSIISYSEFLRMQTSVIFEQEFKESFNVRNETIIIFYKNSRYINKYQKRKILNPIVNIFINNIDEYITAIEFERMRYSEFINYLVSICPDNYVADYYLQKKIQMTFGDYGL